MLIKHNKKKFAIGKMFYSYAFGPAKIFLTKSKNKN